MISIKRYLSHSEDEAVFWQVVCLLLEKIGSQAVKGDPADYEAFLKKFQQISESVAASATPETLLVTAGAVVQAMSDYNQRVSKFIRRQNNEVQTIVSMLTETIVKMSGENTEFARSFAKIGNSMEQVGALNDLDQLKLQLHDCLRDFRNEALRQKAETEGMITDLQRQVERSRERGGAAYETDPATGLPLQEAAEAAMQRYLKAGTRNYVVTLVVSRMQSLNARFGHEVGDCILRTCREHVEQRLMKEDLMFRWTGPSIVLLLERADSLEVVRGQLKRLLDPKIEESFDVGTRSVLIPISLAWSAFKLVSPVGIAIRQIQTFIASQSSRDFA